MTNQFIKCALTRLHLSALIHSALEKRFKNIIHREKLNKTNWVLFFAAWLRIWLILGWNWMPMQQWSTHTISSGHLEKCRLCVRFVNETWWSNTPHLPSISNNVYKCISTTYHLHSFVFALDFNEEMDISLSAAKKAKIDRNFK